MSPDTVQRLRQAVVCLMCFVLAITNSTPSEFGWLTGLIFKLNECGTWLFLLALILTFPLVKTGAAMGIGAALLSLPWYLYAVFPGAFRFFWPGEYSVPLSSNVVSDRAALLRITFLVAAAWICIDSLRVSWTPQNKAISAEGR